MGEGVWVRDGVGDETRVGVGERVEEGVGVGNGDWVCGDCGVRVYAHPAVTTIEVIATKRVRPGLCPDLVCLVGTISMSIPMI